MKVCQACGYVNHCERCTQYTCVCCGADLEGPASMPPLVQLEGILVKAAYMCTEYENMKGRTRTTRELAWRLRKTLDDGLVLLRQEIARRPV